MKPHLIKKNSSTIFDAYNNIQQYSTGIPVQFMHCKNLGHQRPRLGRLDRLLATWQHLRSSCGCCTLRVESTPSSCSHASLSPRRSSSPLSYPKQRGRNRHKSPKVSHVLCALFPPALLTQWWKTTSSLQACRRRSVNRVMDKYGLLFPVTLVETF